MAHLQAYRSEYLFVVSPTFCILILCVRNDNNQLIQWYLCIGRINSAIILTMRHLCLSICRLAPLHPFVLTNTIPKDNEKKIPFKHIQNQKWHTFIDRKCLPQFISQTIQINNTKCVPSIVAFFYVHLFRSRGACVFRTDWFCCCYSQPHVHFLDWFNDFFQEKKNEKILHLAVVC